MLTCSFKCVQHVFLIHHAWTVLLSFSLLVDISHSPNDGVVEKERARLPFVATMFTDTPGECHSWNLLVPITNKEQTKESRNGQRGSKVTGKARVCDSMQTM